MSKTDSKARNRFEFVSKFKTKDVSFAIKYAGVSANYIYFEDNILDIYGNIDATKIPVYEVNGDVDYVLHGKNRDVVIRRDRFIQSGIFRGDGADDLALVFDESLLDVNHDSWTSPYTGMITVPFIKVGQDGLLTIDEQHFNEAAAELRLDYSEIKTDSEPITDARVKVLSDFKSTLKLLVASLRIIKLTDEPLSIINSATSGQLINVLFACAQKFYSSAVTSGKMFTFPSTKTGGKFYLPYKLVEYDTGQETVYNKELDSVYYLSIKDFLTYLTPMLKHASGAYNGAGAQFSVNNPNGQQHRVSYEGFAKGINTNLTNDQIATRTRYTSDDNSLDYIHAIAGDVIIVRTSDKTNFFVGPAVKVTEYSGYFEIKCYRPTIIQIKQNIQYALFNNKYDAPVLIATKHALKGQTFTFTGAKFKRLVEGQAVNVDNYQFKLNDLVKVNLNDLTDSYYTSNEILRVRSNGSLLDIVDPNYFPIAAGDYSTVACDLTLNREDGVVTGMTVKFDQDIYVTSLQVQFQSGYSYNANNNALYIDTSVVGTLSDLLNNNVPYTNISVQLFNYPTAFATPTFKAKWRKTMTRWVTEYVTDLNVSGNIDFSSVSDAYSGYADYLDYDDDEDAPSTSFEADYVNLAYVFEINGDTFALVYNIDEGAYDKGRPTSYLKLNTQDNIFYTTSKDVLDAAVAHFEGQVSFNAYNIVDSGQFSDYGNSIVRKLHDIGGQGHMGYYCYNTYNVLWFTEGYTAEVTPSIINTYVKSISTSSQERSAKVNDLASLLSSGTMLLNFIPEDKTVDAVSVTIDDEYVAIADGFDEDYYVVGYHKENINERDYDEYEVNWELTIPNSLSLAPVRALFSEEDVQYISTHCLNVFMNRTNIAEIIASYVAPNLKEISPTLLADAQTFLQSSMRDSIEATLMAVEDVMLNSDDVTNSDDLTDDDNSRLVYYISKAGHVAKGVVSAIKNDIQEGSDVIDVEAIHSDEHLISVPRMDSEGQLVFDAPCSLEDIPTTINDGTDELPLLQAVLKSKLAANSTEGDSTETDVVTQNVSDYVSRMVDVYGDYSATIIEADMTNVIDEIAESNPDISLADATAVIQSKADQVQAEMTNNGVIIDAVEKAGTISSRLQDKVVAAAAKAKTSTVAIITDSYAKFGKISNGISTKVSAFASKLYSVANDIGQSVIKMFGTGTEVQKDNWNGSGNITNRSNLSLAFDINFPDLNVVGAAKAAVSVVSTVAEKIYDKCANFVKKTFQDGVSFKVNESGYETLDCPAYSEVMTLTDFRAIYGSLATYLETYRTQTQLENVTFVTQMNTEIIFIQLHADNYVKIICNPLIDIEDTKDVNLESDLDFLDRMLAAIERAVDDYNIVADRLNSLFSILDATFRNLVNNAAQFNHITFDKSKQYSTVFAGAKVSTKEKAAKGWKIFGWVTAAVGAVLCCTGIASGAGAALIGAGAALVATGYAVEEAGKTSELNEVIKKAREDTAFANAEITSAELLGVWNSCPVEVGQLYLFVLPMVFEGGFVHPGNGRLLEDGRYIPCAIFSGFPSLKYSLVTDDERAKQTRRGLLTIAAVVIGTIVAARLATRKARAKKKYKKVCAEQWALENPSRDSKFDANGKVNKWWTPDPSDPSDESKFTFNQAKFTKAKQQYFKKQEKLAWKSSKLSNILGGAGGVPSPSYDGSEDFDELSSIIGYRRSGKK